MVYDKKIDVNIILFEREKYIFYVLNIITRIYNQS